MTEKIKIDEEEINSILNSYEMQGTPELSNVDNNKTLHKENENSKVTKKNSNIPFISKNKKENNEETTEVIKKEKKPVDVNRKDEIDTLVCDIMKNPKRLKESIKIAQNTSSSLDFDEVEDITNINHIDEIYNTYFQENCTKNTKQVLNPNRKINKSNLTNKTSASHEKIIDPATLNEKEEFSNSEIIKCITEVSLNSKWYGFSFSTKSKIFWNEVSQSKSFKNIFQNYKPDTLKKYWILLSEIKEKDKLISVIEKYRNIIDCSKLK